jgi:hypothetical protein
MQMGTARTATVVATEYCELYSLSRSDLEAVMQRFPELAVDLNILTGAATAPLQCGHCSCVICACAWLVCACAPCWHLAVSQEPACTSPYPPACQEFDVKYPPTHQGPG